MSHPVWNQRDVDSYNEDHSQVNHHCNNEDHVYKLVHDEIKKSAKERISDIYQHRRKNKKGRKRVRGSDWHLQAYNFDASKRKSEDEPRRLRMPRNYNQDSPNLLEFENKGRNTDQHKTFKTIKQDYRTNRSKSVKSVTSSILEQHCLSRKNRDQTDIRKNHRSASVTRRKPSFDNTMDGRRSAWEQKDLNSEIENYSRGLRLFQSLQRNIRPGGIASNEYRNRSQDRKSFLQPSSCDTSDGTLKHEQMHLFESRVPRNYNRSSSKFDSEKQNANQQKKTSNMKATKQDYRSLAIESKQNKSVVPRTPEDHSLVEKNLDQNVARKDYSGASLAQRKRKSPFDNVMDDDYSVKRKIRSMGFKTLKELTNKEPNEILLTFCLPENGFFHLLQHINIDSDKKHLMALILIALGKACKSSHRLNLMIFMNTVTKISMFMLVALQKYLVDFQSCNDELHREAFEKLLEFLTCYNQLLSASASETLSILLPLLKQICRTLESYPIFYCSVNKTIMELEFQKDHFLKKHTMEDLKAASQMEKMQLVQPPENFLTIPVLPTDKDILEHEPFLRSNITIGKYSNVEHYLDVQFRLLREDYIRPLREGIATYLRLKKDGKPLKKCRDIKIYLDIHVIQQQFEKGVLVHLATFDIKEFSKVNWEYSKRFLTGSLVCLSDNDFQTSLFASIAFRDIDKLQKGILILKFEELSEKVLTITPTQTFVMLETDAYFEAYRHNLSVLQQIQPDKFPLTKYIIDVDTKIDNPQYLKELINCYDMGPLLLPLKHESEEILFSAPSRNVSVLMDDQWPTQEELKLDESQFKALKAAITKEFVVIQGPPGTGKTYVGLKIVQLLLHNISCWKSLTNPCPILVVCYTNHALDQFLEGIMSFTKDIVRVGGRTSCEALSPYRLESLRRKQQQNRNVPQYIFVGQKCKKHDLRARGEELKRLQKDIEMSVQKIVGEFKFKKHMKYKHYASLRMHSEMHSGPVTQMWLQYYFPQIDETEIEFVIQRPTFDFVNQSSNPIQPFILPKINVIENTDNRYLAQRLINQTSGINDAIVAAKANMYVNDDDYHGLEHMADVQYIEDMRDSGGEFAGIEFELNSTFEEDFFVSDSVRHRREKNREYIMRQLQNTVSMTEEQVEKIHNVWTLDCNDRWRLYKYWCDLYVRELQNDLLELQEKIKIEHKEMDELRMEENLDILRTAKVVGMTTTGAARNRNMVQYLNPRIVIVEEAAEILEAHIVTSLAPDTQHLILIGDHQQLKPNPNVYELATKFKLDVSLFERMVNNGIDFHQLTEQHRMRSSISALLVPHIYRNLKDHDSVSKYENIKGVSGNMFFISHNKMENQEVDSNSRVNLHEANFIISLCRYFILQGYTSSQITVLTTYSGQLFELKRISGHSPLLKGVRITVVDNFQGEENDIILISFVRSNEDGIIGFLKVANRVSVALSRAKKGLFAIGNFMLLAEKNELWKNIVISLKQQEAIGSALSLKCHNHPETETTVSTAADFDNVPEGGCKLPCKYRLICGHPCPKICHTYDTEHYDVRCEKICDKRCERQHRCRKFCHEECDPCNVYVMKKIPICEHTVLVPCHILPEKYSCSSPCEKLLPCGHSCRKSCGVRCSGTCLEMVSTKLACGHDKKLECHKVPGKNKYLSCCSVKCATELECGHICSGTCSKCYQGRLHQSCKEKCKRILVCGHECQVTCCRNCPPCSQKCLNKCTHSKCPEECGFPCGTCKEPCLWACRHKKCSKKCGELCDREPCDAPCSKLLPCKHPCIGLCNEPCPKLCRVCNPDVKEIFFGSEDDDNAKFVELGDCKHVFEVKGLTHWMQLATEKDQEIQMKSCPKCKTVIWKSLRFGNIIKTCLKSIEKVKKKIFGQKKRNENERTFLLGRIEYLEYKFSCPSFMDYIFQKLLKTRKIGIIEILRYKNIISLMEDYLPVKKYINNFYLTQNSLVSCNPGSDKVKNFVQMTYELIKGFLSENFSTVSEQQLQELSWEIQRLKLIEKFLEISRRGKRDSLSENNQDMKVEVEDLLCKLGPFRDAEEKRVKFIFQKMGAAIINISTDEKTSILKAMNLSRGHWYQCPNGHVYCITECGGAMQESKCYECGTGIGGRNHALRSDNRVASDMDGARFSAWSEAYDDMRNYDEFQ